jgi:SnoaL-like domain
MDIEQTVKKMEARIKELEGQLQKVNDIEEIKKLQRAYGYYLEHWNVADILDLFSHSPELTVKVHAGEFRGWESVRRFFLHGKNVDPKTVKHPPTFLHQVMQLSPIIDVAPDGKRAWGRWYGFGANAFEVPGGIAPGWMDGVYENEYIKENGKWKILKLMWYMFFHAPYLLSWVDPKKRVDVQMEPDFKTLNSDGPSDDTFYPSEFLAPFHYKHPVTGGDTPINK